MTQAVSHIWGSNCQTPDKLPNICPVLPSGLYKRGVGWPLDSDAALKIFSS